MLYSLDLFTGIGGLTIALHGIVTPVAYCDILETAQKVISNNICLKRLHKAPICHDIHSISKTWVKINCNKVPNTIVAGFPCIGFSVAGKKNGFENTQSALFFEMLRICDECNIRYMFLENVPAILDYEMDVIVQELVDKRGFQIRWCLMSASDLGAPHKRKRWFCIAYKTQLPIIPAVSDISYEWTSEPQRMSTMHIPNHRQRHFLLGNSVVPCVARYAYMYLLTNNQRYRTISKTKPCYPDAGFIDRKR